VTARAFVEQAKLGDIIAVLQGDIKIAYLEDLAATSAR
jgi:hypothetical protein